jgi:phosphoribosylformylglycinamidine synthase
MPGPAGTHAAAPSTALLARPAAARTTASVPYPDNPNGAMADTAGVCDATGRVLGLMPHPERHIDPTQHPRWTRGEAGPVGDGLQVFVNAVSYFS